MLFVCPNEWTHFMPDDITKVSKYPDEREKNITAEFRIYTIICGIISLIDIKVIN